MNNSSFARHFAPCRSKLVSNIHPSQEYVDFVDFIINLMPIVIICCVPLTFFMLYYYKKELGGEPREFSIELLKKQYPITNPLLLLQSGIIMFTVMLLFFLEVRCWDSEERRDELGRRAYWMSTLLTPV